MILNYKITISPFCKEEVISLFDAIATQIGLYQRARIFLDLRNGPVYFVPLNAVYSIILNEESGYLKNPFNAAEAAFMINQWKREGQIERVFLEDQTEDKIVESHLHDSAVLFERVEAFDLLKNFTLDNLSEADYITLQKLLNIESQYHEIKLPNIEFCCIELSKGGEILIDGEPYPIENLKEKIRAIELEFLCKFQDKHDYNLNDLIDLLGPTILDECYCFFNPDSTKQDYSNYKIRLLEWFFQLEYKYLYTYTGTNYVVRKLLSSINAQRIILPADYFRDFRKL